MKNLKQKGINLIEVIVVMAIIGIVLAVAVPQFSKMKRAQVLKSAGQDIFSTINKARSETLASFNSSEYGVHFDSDKVVLFKGNTYVANDVNNVILNIVSPAIISNISPSQNTSVYFSRLSGMPNPSGITMITVSVPNDNLSKTITISVTGLVNIN